MSYKEHNDGLTQLSPEPTISDDILLNQTIDDINDNSNLKENTDLKKINSKKNKDNSLMNIVENKDIKNKTNTSITSSNKNKNEKDGNNDKYNPSLKLLYYLLRAQRYSAYLFTGFVALHIPSVILIPAITRSIDVGDQALMFTRTFYQSRLLEPALVYGALSIHVASGIAIRAFRMNQHNKYYGPNSSASPFKSIPSLSPVSKSGYMLTLVLTGHIFIERVIPYIVDGDSSLVSLRYVADAICREPFRTSIGLFLLSALTSFHVLFGFKKLFSVSKYIPFGKWKLKLGWNAKVAKVGMGLMLSTTAVSLYVISRAGKSSGWLGSHYEMYHRYLSF